MKKTLVFVLLAVMLCSALVLGLTSILHADCASDFESCMAGCGVPGPSNPNHATCVNGCMSAAKDCDDGGGTT